MAAEVEAVVMVVGGRAVGRAEAEGVPVAPVAAEVAAAVARAGRAAKAAKAGDYE